MLAAQLISSFCMPSGHEGKGSLAMKTSLAKRPYVRVLAAIGTFCLFAAGMNFLMFEASLHPLAEVKTATSLASPSHEFKERFGVVMVAVANIWNEDLVRYCDWAMLSAQSLRSNGRYYGPVFLVTNYDLSERRYVDMIAKWDITIIHVDVERELMEESKMYGQRYKMRLVDLVPDDIRYLLYIDIDVLIGYPLDGFISLGESYMQNCTMAFFKGRNLSQKPNQPYQGGTFFVDLAYGVDFVHEWEETLMVNRFPKDQMALYVTIINRLSNRTAPEIREVRDRVDTDGFADVFYSWDFEMKPIRQTPTSIRNWWFSGAGSDPVKEREFCHITHKHDWVLFPYPSHMKQGKKNDLNHISFTGFLKKVTEAELQDYLRNVLLLDTTGLSLYFPVMPDELKHR